MDEPALPIRWQDAKASSDAITAKSHLVVIGDDCWFGINVVVLPGVTIGRGCVIAANTVVTGDLPPYSVAAGAPARVVKVRLDFAPPKALVAENPEHLPYFYAGFEQWVLGVSQLKQVLIRDGLQVQKDEFVLALDVRDGDRVHLKLWAGGRGALQHGGQSVLIHKGETHVAFRAHFAAQNFLAFRWTGTPPAQSSRLVVIEARKDQ